MSLIQAQALEEQMRAMKFYKKEAYVARQSLKKIASEDKDRV